MEGLVGCRRMRGKRLLPSDRLWFHSGRSFSMSKVVIRPHSRSRRLFVFPAKGCLRSRETMSTQEGDGSVNFKATQDWAITGAHKFNFSLRYTCSSQMGPWPSLAVACPPLSNKAGGCPQTARLASGDGLLRHYGPLGLEDSISCVGELGLQTCRRMSR